MTVTIAQDALDAVYEDLGTAATFLAAAAHPSDAAADILVLPDQGRGEYHIHDLRFSSDSNTVLVRRAQVPAIEKGDIITLNGRVFTCSGVPKCEDPDRLEWRVELQEAAS